MNMVSIKCWSAQRLFFVESPEALIVADRLRPLSPRTHWPLRWTQVRCSERCSVASTGVCNRSCTAPYGMPVEVPAPQHDIGVLVAVHVSAAVDLARLSLP